jgi:hypothetical protein
LRVHSEPFHFKHTTPSSHSDRFSSVSVNILTFLSLITPSSPSDLVVKETDLPIKLTIDRYKGLYKINLKSGSHRSVRCISFNIKNVSDHSGRAVWGTNCLRSLEHWDRGFQSHSRHGCMCAFILCSCCPACRYRPCDGLIPPSKESYRLCIDQKSQGLTERCRAIIIIIIIIK